MQIRVHSLVPCADVAGYSCTASVDGITPGDFATRLKQAGFTVASMPSSGTVIGRRDATMIFFERSGQLTITRLVSREHANDLIQELLQYSEGGYS